MLRYLRRSSVVKQAAVGWRVEDKQVLKVKGLRCEVFVKLCKLVSGHFLRLLARFGVGLASDCFLGVSLLCFFAGVFSWLAKAGWEHFRFDRVGLLLFASTLSFCADALVAGFAFCGCSFTVELAFDCARGCLVFRDDDRLFATDVSGWAAYLFTLDYDWLWLP